MLRSEQKPFEEILGYLEGEEKVFIVGCDGCAQASQTGGLPQALEMKERLEGEGKTVSGCSVVDFLCQINLGGSRGEWQGSERCMECGDCLLEYTGGICPLTVCSKGLRNGPCGGASNGKCEVSPEKPCGWELIYARLKETGRLDVLKTFIPPKDWNKMRPRPEMLSTSMWALEQMDTSREGGTV